LSNANIACIQLEIRAMATLHIRDLDDDVAQGLRERAARNARSMEAEVRALLAAAIAKPRRRSFAEVLASMPDVGEDGDFARVQSGGRPTT
jgi:antitoxin FitA